MNMIYRESIIKAAIIEESARWEPECHNTPAAWLALRDFAKSIGITVTPDEQYKAAVARMEAEE